MIPALFTHGFNIFDFLFSSPKVKTIPKYVLYLKKEFATLEANPFLKNWAQLFKASLA